MQNVEIERSHWLHNDEKTVSGFLDHILKHKLIR